jgi:hypothetical protein
VRAREAMIYLASQPPERRPGGGAAP